MTKDCMKFKGTDEFTAPYKDGKFAIHSAKKGFVTDYIFDKISFCPDGKYFVVQKDGHNMLIDLSGVKIDFPELYPNNFRMEALEHYRVYSKDKEKFLKVQKELKS